jgi:hypothetical protein
MQLFGITSKEIQRIERVRDLLRSDGQLSIEDRQGATHEIHDVLRIVREIEIPFPRPPHAVG